jgi:hypothetical protein
MSSNIQFVNLSQYEPPVITESKRDNWVEFGGENNYFQFLIDRYNHSTTNSAIISNVTRLIYGRGLGVLNADRKPHEYAQVKTLFHDDCIRKIVMDRKLLGQFALQVHYNASKSKILKAYHMPVNLLRAEKCNKEGEIEGYYYSDDWTDPRKFEPKRIPAFGFGGKNEVVEILYSKPYTVGMKYYAYPDYQGSLPYALLEQEISEYLINDVQNGFSPTMIVNFNNGVPTEEQQNIIDGKVRNQLTGSKGKKVLTSFNDNKDMATTVEAVALNDAPKHYEYLAEECMRKIMLGHNVTSPLLFGVASTNGFSSNADELKNSAILFDNMVIRPIQDEIITAFETILHFNGLSVRLFFKTLQPLEFTDLENVMTEEQVQEETGTELSAQNPDLEAILAQVDEANLSEEWVEVDSREATENETELDEVLYKVEAEMQPETILSRIYKFVSSGSAKPNAKSEQDKEVERVDSLKFFKVRYRYTGNKTPDRAFCKAMMAKQDRLFRKEDIDAMSQRAVNPGFGEGGANTYDIFKFKGGARCHHKWERVTFMRNVKGSNRKFEQIGTRAAEIKGYKVTNPYEVSIYPNNLPLKGFSPNNPNLPKDAK